jgi:hypothetical protein
LAIIGAPYGTPAWPHGPLSTLLPPGVTWVAFSGAARSIICCIISTAMGEPVNSRPCAISQCDVALEMKEAQGL